MTKIVVTGKVKTANKTGQQAEMPGLVRTVTRYRLVAGGWTR